MWSDDTELAFTPLLPEFARSPYPFYAALRSRPGLTYFPDFDIWLASRFEDVAAIAAVWFARSTDLPAPMSWPPQGAPAIGMTCRITSASFSLACWTATGQCMTGCAGWYSRCLPR